MIELAKPTLIERARAIQTKEDFESFLQLFLQNFREQPVEWENNTLGNFLDGMWGFVNGIDAYYMNVLREPAPEKPSWRLFAEILLAARVHG